MYILLKLWYNVYIIQIVVRLAMKYIEGQSRDQITLLPDCIDDLIGQDNPVRVIDAFVDNLDIDEMGFKRPVPNSTGRPSYNPRDLLKLYVYGYMNKIRTSRKLMKECGRNIELFYLLNRLTPDFRTISDFRKDNTNAIHEVFHAFVKVCLKLKLYEKELLAIDGSKIRAVNSKNNCYNEEALEKKLANIDAHISEYLKMMDNADASEIDEDLPTAGKIRAALKELAQRKETYEGYLEKLQESGETQVLLTDPEARRMHSKDGFHCCYNVQTAVDKGSHLIADYEVTNHNTDQGLLLEVAEKVRETLETETLEIVADKGYESRKDIMDCVMNGIVPNVAMKYDKKERIYSVEYEEAEITEEIRCSKKPEDIQKCLHAGILPQCYEETAITVELQEEMQESCFTLNDDGTVTCPMGKKLHKLKFKGRNIIYGSKDACRECSNKCTSGKGLKTVSFGPDTTCVPVLIHGDSRYILNKIPIDARISSYNHTLDRKDYRKPKTVVIRIKEDKGKLKERMCLSEHPFGTVKWYHGAHYLLCKGKKKATAELGLSFLAYNMIRAINLVGIDKLLKAL
jgi:transposase